MNPVIGSITFPRSLDVLLDSQAWIEPEQLLQSGLSLFRAAQLRVDRGQQALTWEKTGKIDLSCLSESFLVFASLEMMFSDREIVDRGEKGIELYRLSDEGDPPLVASPMESRAQRAQGGRIVRIERDRGLDL